MKLGLNECDEETAYFLQHGRYPKHERTCTFAPPERIYSEMFPDIDRSSEGWETQQDPYYCWHGTRIPCWFE